MKNIIDLTNFREKNIFDLGEEFSGVSKSGNSVSFTNYYMKKNGEPFFAVSGEFHFSRCEAYRWEDEIIKMKMCGINVIATYVFWIHHEEEEGVFEFSGRKDIRYFVELCKKHNIMLILRIGPFDHGEVRNGGMPDWLYGKPFEVRHTNEGFMIFTKRLYEKISEQVKGLFFEDDGPIIAVQVDNEYMHSSSPWEITTGISNEWVYSGSEGDAYMTYLRDLSRESGMNPVFYTCTGWGGASTPTSMMPLWGGYAYRPWLFYEKREEHPSTEEYIYQDFHNNEVKCTNDFQPQYKPEDRPYACCEMGGGMMNSYYYRFILPFKSVDAMANIKLASGCNFLGYYVFQGGSNPIGKYGTFMNESQVPKISYDYQAALGEFGQIRESYNRLKCIHYFTNAFSNVLCSMKTLLPEGASDIKPKDLDTLRYAVRSNGISGFLFINNFQDHEITKEKNGETISISLKDEVITFSDISISGDENCILPFNMNLHGIVLKWATAQPITYIENNNEITYVFLRPQGMDSVFKFDENTSINDQTKTVYKSKVNNLGEGFVVSKDNLRINILCIDRMTANRMYLYKDKGIIFTDGALLIDGEVVSVETQDNTTLISAYPKNLIDASDSLFKLDEEDSLWSNYLVTCELKKIKLDMKQVGPSRYTINFKDFKLEGIKDALLRIKYAGDIGQAFIDGVMINDNFNNGNYWEIGLSSFAQDLKRQPITLYITPVKEGVHVNVESAMAARIEEIDVTIAEIISVEVIAVYEHKILS